MKTKSLTAAQIDTLAQHLSEVQIAPTVSATKAGDTLAQLLVAGIGEERAALDVPAAVSSAIWRACWPLCLAGSVWAPHSESAVAGSIVPSGNVVIRPVAMALRTAASETPRCAA